MPKKSCPVWQGAQAYVFCHVVAPLILGVCVYVFLRPKLVLFLEPMSPFIADYLRHIALPRDFHGPFFGVIVNSLPDGLWLYSLICLMLLLWKQDSPQTKRSVIAICLTLAIVAEACQAFGWLPGTYDTMDILFYIAFSLLASLNLIQPTASPPRGTANVEQH